MTIYDPETLAGLAGSIDVTDDTGALFVMPSVYSFAFAATNAEFEAATFPPRLWNVGTARSAFNSFLCGEGLASLPSDGERKLGLLDLVHAPILDGIIDQVTSSMPGFDNATLLHRYPLHGSSAGIGMLLDHLRVTHGQNTIPPSANSVPDG